MSLSVLVADDEPLARAMVAALVRSDQDVGTVFESGDAPTARQIIAEQGVDIAFLDVEMPGMTGLQIASDLPLERPVVVFVTAFGQYAPSAFEVRAVDYVLKPFSDARLLEALDRAKQRAADRRARGPEAPDAAGQAAVNRPPESGYLQRLAVKEGDRAVVLKAADLLWFEAQDYYARVHARTGRHLVRVTLLSLEARLDPKQFLRVHRAAIVNIDEVREIIDGGAMQVVLSDGTRVPVSRARRRKVEAVLAPRLRQS